MEKYPNIHGASIKLQLSGNSEKDAIIKAIISSNDFDVSYGDENTITLGLKRNKRKIEQLLELTKSPKAHVKKGSPRYGLKLSKKQKAGNLVCYIAKSQGITLADPDSSSAIVSGVIK